MHLIVRADIQKQTRVFFNSQPESLFKPHRLIPFHDSYIIAYFLLKIHSNRPSPVGIKQGEINTVNNTIKINVTGLGRGKPHACHNGPVEATYHAIIVALSFRSPAVFYRDVYSCKIEEASVWYGIPFSTAFIFIFCRSRSERRILTLRALFRVVLV